MHQPLPAILAVLGQEPVECAAAEVESIWDRKAVISYVLFFNDGEAGSIYIQKLVRNVGIVKDLIAMVPHLPS
jgi:hypothetical protein